MLVFVEGGKLENWNWRPLETRLEPTTNSTHIHMWHWAGIEPEPHILVGGKCSPHCNISAPWWMYGYCSSYLHPCTLFLLWWLLVNEDGQTITVGWHLLQVLFYFLFNGCMCRERQITLGSILSLLFTDLVPDKRNMGGGGGWISSTHMQRSKCLGLQRKNSNIAFP